MQLDLNLDTVGISIFSQFLTLEDAAMKKKLKTGESLKICFETR